MKPFKYFFFLSIGIVLFFFFAKVLFFAFLIAAGMSVVFFVANKIRSLFTNEPLFDQWEPSHNGWDNAHVIEIK